MRHSQWGPPIPSPLLTNGRTPHPMDKIPSKRLHTHLEQLNLSSKWYANDTFQHCGICNRAKPNRRGGASLQPLGIPEYPSGIVGFGYVTDLPKSGLYGHTGDFIMFVT